MRASRPAQAPAASASAAASSTPATAAADPVGEDTPYAAAAAAAADQQAFPQLDAGEAESEQQPGFSKVTSRAWHLFDARGQVVGRMAGRIATLLQGKHKPSWTPWLDNGDAVVVLNARHLVFTGSKWSKKIYRYHTGYVGGLKEIVAERWRDKHADRILRHAVAGMIKKNKLKIPRLARLKIYPGVLHPHAAQFPFDPVSQVPHLKAQRLAEIADIQQRRAEQEEAQRIAREGAKAATPQTAQQAAKAKEAREAARKASADSKKGVSTTVLPAGTDDGTIPENPEIKAAILKDREQRKGKPVVML
jgi:large subunit ribosomal protein L13